VRGRPAPPPPRRRRHRGPRARAREPPPSPSPHTRRHEHSTPHPGYDARAAHEFAMEHGIAVRAIAVEVADAAEAFAECVRHGARPVLPPARLAGAEGEGAVTVSEVGLYGDAVLRWVSGDVGRTPFLPGYAAVGPPGPAGDFGVERLDHAVGNVPELVPVVEYLMRATGFHEFAEFTAEDVGTVDSGLNSMVLASDNEQVLLPVNEPTFGTRRKSQIQTYLEQHQGPGVQHMALRTGDIFRTVRAMRERTGRGGFDFMPRASAAYYRDLPARIGGALTADEYRACEELGILVDRDDQGVLLQLFTAPIGDRSAVFLEIIQRLCPAEERLRAEGRTGADAEVGGCGGFGKGNFSELFKSIEDYERTLDV